MAADPQTTANFAGVITALTSQDNQTRKQAEATYKGFVDANSSLVISLLLELMCTSPDPAIQSFSPWERPPRQPIHPDEVYCFPAPTYSIFVALQDIDLAMGPTVFLPRTKTEEAHAVFNSDVNSKNSFLSKCEYKVSVLKQGDVAIFDSRTLHCGSANHSKRRAQLYFTLQNPLIPKEEGVSRNNSMQKGLKLSVKDFA